MKLTAHWPNDLEMPKVVHNVQFTMTNVQSVLMIGQSVVEFIEMFRSMTNCQICRRIVMEHWPNANEKRCINIHLTLTLSMQSLDCLETFGLFLLFDDFVDFYFRIVGLFDDCPPPQKKKNAGLRLPI